MSLNLSRKINKLTSNILLVDKKKKKTNEYNDMNA